MSSVWPRDPGPLSVLRLRPGRVMRRFRHWASRARLPLACLAMPIVCAVPPDGRADTAPSAVWTRAIGPGQDYPAVNANSEGWFDVGGYCKVISVGTLPGGARGIPVFLPGPADQWANWRARAPQSYGGLVAATTCCRPQSDIATLCAGTAAPVPVSRQYGRLGETDRLSATCVSPFGEYTESLSVSCSGDNGPDGQASWQAGGVTDACAPNAQARYGRCSSEGVGGWGSQTVTIYNSCGQVQSTTSQSCYTQPPCRPNGSCSGACGGGVGVDNCGNSCRNYSSCGYYAYQSCTPVSGCHGYPGYVCDCPTSPDSTEPDPNGNSAPWRPRQMPSNCIFVRSISGNDFHTNAICLPPANEGGDKFCYATNNEFYCR